MRKRVPASFSLKRTLAASLFRYSEFLDRLNWTARWTKRVRKDRPCPIFSSREEMYEYLNGAFLGDSRAVIDYFEFGVAEGNSLRSWCGINSHERSRFFGFDSFQGLPSDWTKEHPKGQFSTGGKLPDIGDSRVELVPGWFQQSLPEFLARYRQLAPIVIHNDSDLYSSTLFCLANMNPLIARGTLIIFDEFYDTLHEYRALSDYCEAFLREYKIVAATPSFNRAAIQIL
jgi:O-methyltransferase